MELIIVTVFQTVLSALADFVLLQRPQVVHLLEEVHLQAVEQLELVELVELVAVVLVVIHQGVLVMLQLLHQTEVIVAPRERIHFVHHIMEPIHVITLKTIMITMRRLVNSMFAIFN